MLLLLVQRAEAKFFRSILPQYYEHHRTHPDSVLIRFCGMYLVKKGHKKIPFIVMKWCVTCSTSLTPLQEETKEQKCPLSSALFFFYYWAQECKAFFAMKWCYLLLLARRRHKKVQQKRSL